MLRTCSTRVILAGAALLVAATARPAIITQTRSFDLSSPLLTGQGGNADVLLFDSFDPALGTLSSVDISINGMLELNGTFPANFRNLFPFGIVGFPYTYSMAIEQDFGLGFFNSHDLIFSGNLPGGTSGIPFAFTTTYEHTFSLTSATDLVGLAPVVTTSSTLGAPIASLTDIPPVAVGALRDDFISPLPNVVVPWLATPEYAYTVTDSAISGAVTGTIRANGTVTAIYNFVESAAVPEPGATTLFVVSLVGMALGSRRRVRRPPARKW